MRIRYYYFRPDSPVGKFCISPSSLQPNNAPDQDRTIPLFSTPLEQDAAHVVVVVVGWSTTVIRRSEQRPAPAAGVAGTKLCRVQSVKAGTNNTLQRFARHRLRHAAPLPPYPPNPLPSGPPGSALWIRSGPHAAAAGGGSAGVFSVM
ncbi:hypothetical protein AJ79_04248 [Helicocarpus griseus UAMH5409]|uniref:Uncharacterized protein n=1 Tax=Helicocarpus griseus UAMH5409 TaxID=1447875 RepID=A0A2B7XL83_9EURO|nr:hypothetical protein AJ79_04248 [Helicocarpus griseus UAMH5409]